MPIDRYGRERDVSTDHRDLALRKVHDPRGLVDQNESQSHQTVDAAIGERADQQLHIDIHQVNLSNSVSTMSRLPCARISWSM
jgi:hypothetical protein